MVDDPLLRLWSRLIRRRGTAWGSEAWFRQAICEDTMSPWSPRGHMPGPSTIPKAIRRMEERGLIISHWATRGSILPTGEQAKRGCLLIDVLQVPLSPELAARSAARRGQERILRGRIHSARLDDLRKAMGKRLPRKVDGDTALERERKREDELQRKREADRQRLLELASDPSWEHQRGPPK